MDLVERIVSTDAQHLDSYSVQKYRTASKSRETKRAIQKAWRAFCAWARTRGWELLPCGPEVMEAYLIDLAELGRKVSTIEQARYAIDTRHKMAGLPPPGESEVVKVAMAGIRRTLGSPQRRAGALTPDHIQEIDFRDDLKGLRDRALLLVGVCGGFRRSEMSAIRVEDIERTDYGLRLLLRRSKADQEGVGATVDLVRSTISPDRCPVSALDVWLRASGLRKGPIFPRLRRWNKLTSQPLSPEAINLLVKWAADQCGLDPRRFSGHSLRSGCATFLLDKGVPIHMVAQHLRHRRLDTTLKYDRNATARALRGVY